MIHFGNIEYVPYIALASAIVIALYAIYLAWKGMMLRRLVKNRRMRETVIRRNVPAVIAKEVILFVSIVLAALLLLRPQWGEVTREVKNEGVDLLVALDVSRSMLAQDVRPDRLSRAKDAIRLLAGELRGDRVGLLLFAGEAFLQCPLTGDLGAFSMFLDAADSGSIRLQGTNLGAAFDAAYRVFHRRVMTSRNFVIITDGEDHEGDIDDAASRFRDLGVSVFVVAIGNEGGELIPSPPEDRSGDVYLRDSSGNFVRTRKNAGLLERIARETGGEYLDITDSLSGMNSILRRISGQERTRFGSRVITERKEQYQAFALLLALLLMAEQLLPGRRRGW